jgi:hypothetical protein
MINLATIRKIDLLQDFADRVHAAALMYIQSGIYVIPVMPNDKSLPYPVKKYNINYSHASRNKKVIDKWYGEGGKFRGFNIGIACGREGGVFAVDVDTEDKHGNKGYDSLQMLEDKHGILEAPIQSTPSGGRHYLYQWADFAKSSTGKIAKAIDTRGGDADACKSHIVAYPSIREEGEYKWELGGDTPPMPKWITESMGIPWGGNSNRGNEGVDEEDEETKYTPRQVWEMLKCIDPNDLEYDEWLICLQAVHSQHSDDVGFEMADRWSQRGDRYKANEVALRWKSFDEGGEMRVGSLIFFAKEGGFDPRLEPKGAEEPTQSFDSMVEEYNETFAIVVVGNDVRVLYEKVSANPMEENFKLLATPAFKNLQAADYMLLGDKNGAMKQVGKADVWLKEENRREYRGGLTFIPNGEKRVDDCFNVWQGWAHQPEFGDWSIFKTHIELMCSGNEEHITWMMDWMADAIQDPQNPKGCAVIMKGPEGTGKGTFFNIFGELFGRHYKHIIQEEHLVGKFNAHLGDALLVFADEVTYGGSKKVAGALKGLVTEKWLMLERKGVDSTPYRNCLRLGIASNEDWFIPAGPSSRRWFVLEVPDNVANDKAYFDAIHGQMENGGYGAMMFELQNREITTNLRTAPVTEMLLDQRARSATTNNIVEWWAEKVHGGVLGISGFEELGEEVNWAEVIDKSDAFTDYRDWCRETGSGKPQPQGTFNKKMEKDFGFEQSRMSNPHNGERRRMFRIPDLDKSAKILAKLGIITQEEESDEKS